MTETPETPTPSLAARLERYGRGTPKMDGSEVVPLPKYRDRPGQVIAILPAPVVADLRAAAAQLRQLDRIKAAYEAVKGEHLATSRPFRADCDNAECGQLVRHLAHELDALEADDGT